MAILRPDSQVSNSGFSLTGGANYATILADESDSTYVTGPVDSSNSLEVLLETGTDPGVNTGFSVHARAYYSSGNGRITLAVYDGATLIHSLREAVGSTVAEIDQSISEANAGNISDFSDLRIRIEVDADPIVLSGTVIVTELWLELPDLSIGGGEVEVPANNNVVQCQHPLPRISAISGQTATTTGVDKADIPVDLQDAIGGQICSLSGLWFPLRRVVIVDGLPYGDIYAPRSENDDTEIFIP